jgi:hypothetical protein
MSSKRRKTVKGNKRQEKRQSQAKWQRRDKKSSKPKQKHKINIPPEINSH